MFRQKRKGFTLSELVVVLAVSTIILLIVFSLIATMQKHSQVRAASARLNEELKAAQSAIETVFYQYDRSLYPAPTVEELDGQIHWITPNIFSSQLVSAPYGGVCAQYTANRGKETPVSQIYLQFNPETLKYEILHKEEGKDARVLFASERITGLNFAKCNLTGVLGEEQNPNLVLCIITYYTTTDSPERTYRFVLEKHSENAESAKTS